jgi:hypothetical protein
MILLFCYFTLIYFTVAGALRLVKERKFTQELEGVLILGAGMSSFALMCAIALISFGAFS